MLGEPAGAPRRQRDAARQQQHLPERSRRVHASTRSTIGATVVEFAINPIGGRWDGQITNERQFNADWNPVWDLAGRPLRGRLDGGSWRSRSSRCATGPGARRSGASTRAASTGGRTRSSFLTRVPRALGQRGASCRRRSRRRWSGSRRRPDRGTSRSSRTRSPSLTSDATATPRVSNDPAGDVGVDVKYGVTQNLTADFTYNTDFAQVEADEQQVNLTRFSLFFPEKREFFLENQGTVRVRRRRRRQQRGRRHADAVLQPPHRPRRRDVRCRFRPAAALTGRVGRYSLGVLEHPDASEDAGVGARRRRTSPWCASSATSSGAAASALIVTGRSIIAGGDGAQPGLRRRRHVRVLRRTCTINTYWARTQTRPACAGDDTSYRAQLDYAGDRYGVQLEHLVDRRRLQSRKSASCAAATCAASYGQFRFSPRPRIAAASSASTRASGTIDYIENGAGRLETRDMRRRVRHRVPEQRHASASATATPTSSCRAPFAHRAGVTLPVGGYDFDNVARRLQLRPAAARVGQRVRRDRHVLRRPQDDAQRQPADA